MASASTLSVEKSYMYDVFISFRGKDLRTSFVDHLCDAFRKSGIIVFKDDKDIEVGERISDELPKAIKGSKFHIVIFSKRYADSYWCLNELIEILECQNPGDPTFYPIFYHVKPSEVRNQEGPVGEAFSVHLENEAAGVMKRYLQRFYAMPSDVEGRSMMKRRMPNIKVLVILDDVNDVKQLEALAEPSCFRPGSRIIITSRERRVLVAHGVQSHNIHDVRMLSNEDAIRLHSRYAFKTESPAQGYEELSKEVLRYAAGLPLTIKTLSSFLCDRPKDVWKDAIKKLETIPWGDTLKILEISYDALEKDQKDIFLHVACLLKGKTKKKAIRILESLGFFPLVGLSDLEQKSLITFRDGNDDDDDKELVLHDHIEEMGMHIVRSVDPDFPERHKLLWIKDEIENIVEKDMGTKAIRGIKLLQTGVHPAKISESLIKMSKLCFLYVGRGYPYTPYIFDDAGKYLPNSLQFLHWCDYPYRYLPKTFDADKLVQMEMPGSNIHQLLEGGEKKVLPKLRFLNLSFSKLETFDSAITPNLEELVLIGCANLVEVNISGKCLHVKKLELSGSIALEKLTISNECQNLEELNLYQCTSFRELQMHGECPRLKSLCLSETKLRSLNLGLTPNLERLMLRDCEDFEELVMPVQCQKLTQLSVGGIKLRSLNLGLTPNLEGLQLGNCEDFEELVMPVERPARLRVLFLFGFESNDEPWPFSNLEKLKSLEELYLRFKDMNRLPDSICMLKHLRVLDLGSCRKLKQLPEDLDRLECLEELNVQSCRSLRNIPNCICKMTRLKRLNLSWCYQLEKLPDEFGRLQSLQVLKVIDIADRLKNLSKSISQLKDLVVMKDLE